MSPENILTEFELHGRLSRRAVSELHTLLRSDDPFRAITVAADTGCLEVASQVAECLSSSDAMVRWNAAATLFTRFRCKNYARQCLDLALNDPDEIVRTICLVGIGEIITIIKNDDIVEEAAGQLLRVFYDENEYPEVRCAAYEGILAAMDILPLDRPPVDKLLDLNRDTDYQLVEGFRRRFGLQGKTGT